MPLEYVFNRLLDKIADVGESDDLCRSASLQYEQAEPPRSCGDILLSGEFWIEAGTQFQQRSAMWLKFQPCRRHSMCRRLTAEEVGSLTATVTPDDTDRFALLDLERHAPFRIRKYYALMTARQHLHQTVTRFVVNRKHLPG
jgi:hypothetical protein